MSYQNQSCIWEGCYTKKASIASINDRVLPCHPDIAVSLSPEGRRAMHPKRVVVTVALCTGSWRRMPHLASQIQGGQMDLRFDGVGYIALANVEDTVTRLMGYARLDIIRQLSVGVRDGAVF
jgi:hypothetical protein